MHKKHQAGAIALAMLRVISTLELLSLALIVANRYSAHLPVITSTGGPIHGILYVSTIAMVLILPFPQFSKWLAVIPAVGGLLALWWLRHSTAHQAHPSHLEQHVDISVDGAAVHADQVTVHLPEFPPIGPLSFTLPPSTIILLTGSNGSGKSIMLRLICGLITPSSGSLKVANENHGGVSGSGVGALIDGPAFLSNLTVMDNLLVLNRLLRRKPSAVNLALKRVKMLSRAHQKVGTLSLGMKQRVGIAAALLGDPKVVVLDEPTNGLDQRGKTDLLALLSTLRSEGRTILVVSHAVEDFEDICDRLIVMEQGKFVFQGTPEELTASSTTGTRGRHTLTGALARLTASAEAHPPIAGKRVEMSA